MKLYEEKGIEWFGRLMLVNAAYETIEQSKAAMLVIDDANPVKREGGTVDEKRGIIIHFEIVCRRLGENTGLSIAVDLLGQLASIRNAMQRSHKATEQDMVAITSILGRW